MDTLSQSAAPVIMPQGIRSLNFKLFAGARLFYIFPVSSYILSVNWWLYSLNSRILSIATLQVCMILPKILFGSIAGQLADTRDRKSILIGANLLGAFATTITLLVINHAGPGSRSVVPLCIAAAIQSTAFVLTSPCEMSLLRSLIPNGELLRANSVLQLGSDLITLASPIIAGSLYAALSVQAVLYFYLFSYAIALVALVLVKREGIPQCALRPGGFRRRLHSALFTTGADVLWLSALTIAVNLFMSSMAVLLIPYARNTLGLGSRGTGFLFAVVPVGSLLTNSYLAVRQLTSGSLKFVPVLCIVLGLCYTGLGFSRNLVLSSIVMFAIGCIVAAAATYADTLFLKRVAPEIQGTFFGSLSSVNHSVRPLGVMGFGALAAATGQNMAFIAGGIAIIVLAVAALFSRRVLALARPDESHITEPSL
jgi:MFS family permease